MISCQSKILALLICVVICSLAHSADCLAELAPGYLRRNQKQGHLIVRDRGDGELQLAVYRGNVLQGTQDYPKLSGEAGTLQRLGDPMLRMRAIGLVNYLQGTNPRSPIPELLSDTTGNNFLISFSWPDELTPFQVRAFIRAYELSVDDIGGSYSLYAMKQLNASLGLQLESEIKSSKYQTLVDIGKFRIASDGLNREILLVLSYLADLAAKHPDALFLGFSVDAYSYSLYQRIIHGPSSQWTMIPVEAGMEARNFFTIKGGDLLENINNFLRR